MARRKGKRNSLARAAGPADADGGREPGRFSARRKMEAILRMLRGEALDGLARELGVPAATVAQWREQFLGGGQAALKSRAPDDARDDEIGGRDGTSQGRRVSLTSNSCVRPFQVVSDAGGETAKGALGAVPASVDRESRVCDRGLGITVGMAAAGRPRPEWLDEILASSAESVGSVRLG
ncbi:MAG: helix-turn-helix domain-containing protein [Vicinamibacterales bacterium]